MPRIMNEKPPISTRDAMDALMGMFAVADLSFFMLRQPWTQVSFIEYSILILATAFILWTTWRQNRAR
jgi:hypothetical protein